jgi:GntR family transcriptional regulator/MocR family aminotransferase
MKNSASPVARWTFPIALDPESQDPVFLQIARAVADDVRRGRLKSGQRLPGSRELARTLGVHRNTVVAAYAELAAEGWIETTQAAGSFVSRSIPDVRPRRFSPKVVRRRGVPARAGFVIGHEDKYAVCTPLPPEALHMAGGVPDLRLLPATALARAYRRALQRGGSRLLAPADPRGHPRLLAALAAMLSATRGLAVEPEDLMVTRGSQMAIELLGRTLLGPGDVVAVEDPGYRAAWQVFRSRGARMVPLPVDREGLDVTALEALIRRTRVRAVYLTPHHQYPTTVTLSACRRLKLLDLARREKVVVIEDDYAHEFQYEGRPVLPLASADESGVVVYVGTLAKILAPGLRVGYLVAPRDLLERLVVQRFFIDAHGDHAMEWAIAELFEDGDVLRHARRVRRVYHARRDALVDLLHKHLGAALDFDTPTGGMALWGRVAPDVDADAWADRCLELGVFFFSGRHYAFDQKPRPSVRLGFAALDERELADAVRRMAQALRDVRGRRQGTA